MAAPPTFPYAAARRRIVGWLGGHRDLGLLGLALVLGFASAYAAIGFSLAVAWLEANIAFAGTGDGDPWWWWPLLTLPLGGLVVGLAIARITRDGRPEGVADVIDAYVRPGRRLSLREGAVHAAISAGSIGVGASVGREGPVVHLGASVACQIGGWLRLDRDSVRILIGCGVAAAIAASFNAPIAGVFFALEVVIGNYGLRAFAPIVIASVAGTMISRAHFGDFPAFVVPPHEMASVWEFPAFALLGAGAAVIATAFVRTAEALRAGAAATRLPAWARPAVGGLLIAAIAVFFPEVMGVGYASTDSALQAGLPLGMMLALLAAKFAATVLSIGFGFGGGVFSPSLYLGAMYGGAFGLIAAQIFPALASSHGVYALVGTTAVAGAVLGAPISTILMVFELTGSYPLTAAMMVATVVGGVVQFELKGRSWFHTQLRQRGRDISGDRVALVTEGIPVRTVMRADPATVAADAPLAVVRDRLPYAPGGQVYVVEADGRLRGVIRLEALAELVDAEEGEGEAPVTAADIASQAVPALTPDASLEEARRRLETSGASRLPVVADTQQCRLVGQVDARDVLRAMHRALRDRVTEQEGHG
ncbi:MAG: chloride channel protein [Alphaproteobacteria bacterium]